MPALTVTISLLGLGLLWSLAANAWPSRAFPGPGQVWQVLLREAASGDLFYHLGATLGRVAAAYLVAMVVGSVIGILLGSYRRADRFFILANSRPEALERALKAQVYAVDPVQPVMDVRTMQKLLSDEAYAEPRFNLLLFAIFAGLGLILALSGIYGVISHNVSQQTREIGIRIALGAGFSQVIGMVLKVGAKWLAIGIAVGLGASLASVKLLHGLVRNVSTFDPYSFVAVTLLLVVAGLFASFWPARRAACVDPIAALRNE